MKWRIVNQRRDAKPLLAAGEQCDATKPSRRLAARNQRGNALSVEGADWRRKCLDVI